MVLCRAEGGVRRRDASTTGTRPSGWYEAARRGGYTQLWNGGEWSMACGRTGCAARPRRQGRRWNSGRGCAYTSRRIGDRMQPSGLYNCVLWPADPV